MIVVVYVRNSQYVKRFGKGFRENAFLKRFSLARKPNYHEIIGLTLG